MRKSSLSREEDMIWGRTNCLLFVSESGINALPSVTLNSIIRLVK